MNYFQLYNAQKEAYVFLHGFLMSVSSCVRTNRRNIRLEDKSLSNTLSLRERGQGFPCPWFTGPPNIPFTNSSKFNFSHGSEENGHKTNTLGGVYKHSSEKSR